MPQGAHNIFLYIKKRNEQLEFGQYVYQLPGSVTWSGYPQTPYHEWGGELDLRYLAYKPGGAPYGDWKNTTFSRGFYGDALWKLNYETGLVESEPIPPMWRNPLNIITYVSIPYDALPGAPINVRATIKNIAVGGYGAVKFLFWDRTQWVDKGQTDTESLPQDRSREFVSPLPITMPESIREGEAVRINISALILSGDGSFHESSFSGLNVWAKSHFRNLSATFS